MDADIESDTTKIENTNEGNSTSEISLLEETTRDNVSSISDEIKTTDNEPSMSEEQLNKINTRVAKWHTVTLVPASINSYGSKITSAKVRVGQIVNGYEVTSVSGTTIKVKVYGDIYDDFNLPRSSDLWSGAVKSDYVTWAGTGPTQKVEGATAMLPANNASAYYYFNTAGSVSGAEESYYWSFTLKYNANGGSGAPPDDNYKTNSKYEKSHTFTISEQIPTRSNYTFLGWSKSSTATYQPKASYYMLNPVSGYDGGSYTETLYAVWQKNPTFANIKLRKKFESIDSIQIPTNFYMEYYYGDDLETLKGTLHLKDATKIENNLYEWEVQLPTATDITFKEYNYQSGRYELIGIDGNGNVVKKDHTIPSITFRFPEMLSGGTRTITNYYNYAAITVPYRVEWYDKAGNTLRETSYRNGLESEIATPINDDYIINGYIFDESDNRNILSKKLKESEENVLKLYFYKPIINLHFVKNIEKMDKESKNMATTLFENMKLDKDENYKFQITLINQETKDIIKGVLNSKTGLTINDISPGTYLIKESDDIYFDFINMTCENNNNISLTKSNDDYVLTIDDNISENTTFEININNRIELNRWYEDKKEKMNFFKYSQ